MDAAHERRSPQVDGAGEGKKSRRRSLGRKQRQPDPWDLAAAKFKAGDRVKGVVTRVADFGAFVELEPGVEGLIHISEMTWSRRMKHPSKLVRIGDKVEAVVLEVKSKDRPVSLGIKQLAADPWTTVSDRSPIGTVGEGRVRQLNATVVCVYSDVGSRGEVHARIVSAHACHGKK